MSDVSAIPAAGDRLAKVIARSGLCSRRDAEGWIKDGRVTVNGRKVMTPAFNVVESDKIKVDGEPLAARQGTRVWLYHKPPGLVVTEKDPEGRETIFDRLADKDLPRVVTIGRLDINTEGLLLLTNDGGLKRVLELPATGWLRRYRVRAFGSVTQPQLDALKDGIEIEGIQYGSIDAQLERTQGSNVWIVLALREGKNREVKNVLGALGLQVNRLIRVSFGPFQLGDLAEGEIETVNARVLREQLGKRLAAEANTDFDSEMPEVAAQKKRTANPKLRAAAPGKELTRVSPRSTGKRFHFEDDETVAAELAARAERPRQDRPGRSDGRPAKLPSRPRPEDAGEVRIVHFEDGREEEMRLKPQRRERDGEERAAPWDKDAGSAKNFGRPAHHEDRPARGPRPDGASRPKRDFGDKPKRAFGDKPKSFGNKTYGDKSFGDRPKRDHGDKPRGPRPEGSDRPKHSFGDKPFGARPSRDGADRPARPFGGKPYGDKPRSARPAGAGADRDARSFGDKKPYAGRSANRDGAAPRPYEGKKPYAPRDGGDRPARGFTDKPHGDKKPYGTRPPRDGGDRPAKSFGGKPYGDKPRSAGDRPRTFGDKPRAGGDKSFAEKQPYAGRPSTASRGPKPAGAGDRPRSPRKPRP